MAEQGPEVRTKLTLDDAASEVLKRIQDGFQKTDQEQKKTGKGFRQHFRELATDLQAFYQGVVPAIRSVQEMGKELLMAAAGGQEADIAMGALMSTVQGLPMQQAIEQAAALGDELDTVAIRAGVSGEALGGAFQRLLEITGATGEGVAQARVQIEQIATVAGVLGKDVNVIAQEFGFMQEGVLRTRGHMVQLLQSTGIFGDNLQEAAAGWAKLTEEERARRLQHGLGQLAERLGAAQPSFNNLVQSLDNAWEVAKEKLGEPLINALIPVLQRVVDRLERAAPAIEQFAAAMGPRVAQWVDQAVTFIERGFKWLDTHFEEIQGAITTGFKFAKEVVEFILEHKEAIAAAFGARLALGAGAGIAGAGGPGAALGMLQINAASVALTAVSVAWGLVADQLAQAQKEGVFEGEREKNQKAREVALRQIAAAGKLDEAGEILAAYAEDIRQATLVQEAALRTAVSFEGPSPTGRGPSAILEQELGDPHVAAARAVEAALADLWAFNNQMKLWQQDIQAMAAAVEVENLAFAFEAAAQDQDQARMLYIARLIGGSEELFQAFMDANLLTQEGIGSFTATLKSFAPELAEAFGSIMSLTGMLGTKKEPVKFTNDFRGSKIEVKQEFRDADPDRVAVVFQRDLMRAAETRIRASTGYAFGY